MTLEYSYPRYLEAKRSVDDRALNRLVLQSVRSALGKSSGRPLRVLEIGGGTGSMVRRLVDWNLLDSAEYTLVDSDADTLSNLLPSPAPGVSLHAVHSDICEFLDSTEAQFDFVIAHAVLDLINLEQLLPLLWRRCAPGAHYWFTINFDGESVFLPPSSEDAAIWQAYHESMNRRPGSSHAGRNLFAQLTNSGASIDAAGSSDWVVHPHGGAYPEQEAYFLHHILYTIDNELRASPPVPSGAFASWVARRHEQIQASELIYIAHQLDFFGTSA